MNSVKSEKTIFEEFLVEKNLKHSNQREQILDVFLDVEKHLTAEELHKIVREKYPNIGYVTVYRTLKLLCEAGLCRELHFEDGTARYEHLYGHQHHDHLICTKCGQFIAVVDPEIERLQNKLFRTHGFIPGDHRMELYGICDKRKNK